MHGLICQVFTRNPRNDVREILGEGKYDLEVYQDIILPQVWECVVEPGWRVSIAHVDAEVTQIIIRQKSERCWHVGNITRDER